ncbi:MAG: phenylacetate--CoA ligase family protein [Planctomycetia bacterium]|nr:phenylacetate--CoA ligase family protein [Planctomycetia bacterium]
MTDHDPAPQPDARAAIDAIKLERLRRLLRTILPRNGFYARKLARVSPRIESLAELVDWPFTFKEELVEAASATGLPANLTWPVDRYVRFHQTSGTHGRPLPVFDTADDWAWWMECWRSVLARGGVGGGDRVLVASSFGPYAGFWSGFEAAVAGGAMAIPTGGMSSIARLELLRSLAATVLVATPSYALHLAEVGRDAKIDTPGLPIRLVVVAGEPGGSVASVRARIGEAWGAAVLDHAGATEVGPWGVGDLKGGGLDVIEPWFHAEFLAVSTGAVARPGELAELVLTTLSRSGAPVIRYRTGDLVRPRWPSDGEVAEGACPWVRLEGGILGRTDDMLVVRGVNIFPGAIDEIVRSFPEVVEYRLTVSTRASLDEIGLEIEDRLGDPGRVARELAVRLGLRVEVTAAPIGSLPRFEGKARRLVDRRPAAGRPRPQGMP